MPIETKSVVMCISRRWDKDGDLWRQTVFSYKTSNKWHSHCTIHHLYFVGEAQSKDSTFPKLKNMTCMAYVTHAI